MSNSNNKSGLERAGTWFYRMLGMDSTPSAPSFLASKGVDCSNMDRGAVKRQGMSFDTLGGEVMVGGGLYPRQQHQQDFIYYQQATQYKDGLNSIKSSLNSSPVVYVNQSYLNMYFPNEQHVHPSEAKELRYIQSCPSQSSTPSLDLNLAGLDPLELGKMTPEEKKMFLEEQRRQYHLFNELHLQKQQNSHGKEAPCKSEVMDRKSWVMVNNSNDMEQLSLASSISFQSNSSLYSNNAREHSLYYSERAQMSVYDSPNSLPGVWSNLNPNAEEWTGRNKKCLNPEAKEWIPMNSEYKVSILNFVEDNNTLNRKKSLDENINIVTDNTVDESVDEVDGCMPPANEKKNILVTRRSGCHQSNGLEEKLPESANSHPTLCKASQITSVNSELGGVTENKEETKGEILSSVGHQNEDNNANKVEDDCKSSSVSDCSVIDGSDSFSENDNDSDCDYDDDTDTDSDILFENDSSIKHESDNDSDCDIVFGNEEDDCDDEIVNYLDNLDICCSTVLSLRASSPEGDKVSPCSFINVCDLSDEETDEEEDDDIDWECSSGPSKTCISAADWEFGLDLNKSNTLSCQSKMVTYIDKERKNSLSEADKANLRWETEVEIDVRPKTDTRVRFSDDITVEYVDADVDRVGEWEVYARNSMRFRNRVKNLACVLNVVLDSKHRGQIYEERFKKEE